MIVAVTSDLDAEDGTDGLDDIHAFIVSAEFVDGPDELHAMVSDLWPHLLHKIKPPRHLMH
jgi:hypothetical protein